MDRQAEQRQRNIYIYILVLGVLFRYLDKNDFGFPNPNLLGYSYYSNFILFENP